MYTNVNKMIEARKTANALEDSEMKAFAYCNEVKPFFDVIKYHSDRLERIIGDEYWPLPKLRELLFTK
jgi:glutamine synthetase